METKIISRPNNVLILFADCGLHEACDLSDKINSSNKFDVVEIRYNNTTHTSALTILNKKDYNESDLMDIVR